MHRHSTCSGVPPRRGTTRWRRARRRKSQHHPLSRTIAITTSSRIIIIISSSSSNMVHPWRSSEHSSQANPRGHLIGGTAERATLPSRPGLSRWVAVLPPPTRTDRRTSTVVNQKWCILSHPRGRNIFGSLMDNYTFKQKALGWDGMPKFLFG